MNTGDYIHINVWNGIINNRLIGQFELLVNDFTFLASRTSYYFGSFDEGHCTQVLCHELYIEKFETS